MVIFENVLFLFPPLILLVFIFSNFIYLLIQKIYNINVKWNYQNHIFITNLLNDKNNNEELRIFTLNSNYYKKYLKYLPKSFKNIKSYKINDELKDYKYDKFDIRKLNLAYSSVVCRIIEDKNDESLILQNMNKPRDYFELVSALLINNINSTISILTLDEPKLYFPEDFTVRNILKNGSHIFYGKKGKKIPIEMYSIYSIIFNERILVGNCRYVDNIVFIKDIKNKYFHIKLYLINKYKYGIAIVQNYLELEEITLYYIAQFYNL